MFIMGIVVTNSQFKIVRTLKKNGYNAFAFFFLPSNLKKYKRLINEVNSQSVKAEMRATYYWFIIPAIIGLISFCLSIVIAIIINNRL